MTLLRHTENVYTTAAIYWFSSIACMTVDRVVFARIRNLLHVSTVHDILQIP
jgi:hypothetical protein